MLHAGIGRKDYNLLSLFVQGIKLLVQKQSFFIAFSESFQDCFGLLYHQKQTNNNKKSKNMKNRLKSYVLPALAVLGAFSFQSCDKDDDVRNLPTQIQQAFQAQYPGVNWVEWEKEWGNYKADFMYNGSVSEWNNLMLNTQAEAWYTADGQWLRTEFDVQNYYYNQADTEVVPAKVREAISQVAGGLRVEDLDRVDMPAGQQDYFDLELDSEPNDIQKKIDFEGNIIG